MSEEVPAFDVIIVITRAAIQVTLARKSPPAQMQATLQEDIPDFLLKLRPRGGLQRGARCGSRAGAHMRPTHASVDHIRWTRWH
eukprot:scaffold10003_cov117-Isochrysis_galbana.AAC.1